ncbi:MAG: GTP-binding protein [Nanoarchaeota archaeon]|nr:GTP-binding protein [Nanoarchaeota archaeon]
MPRKPKKEKVTEEPKEEKKSGFGLIRRFINKVIGNIFRKKKHVKLGLYGPPNGGKTTLANRICKDWLGEEMGSVSAMGHETREIQIKEQINIKSGSKELSFNLIDTPGIATRIDYEDFVKKGMKKGQAKKRAKEATKGVIDSIKWLDDMDVVVIVLDATLDPYTQVNITIIGNLVARNIPVLIVGNKVDLKKADLKRIEAAFPQYDVIGISAKFGKNIDKLYEALFVLVD